MKKGDKGKLGRRTSRRTSRRASRRTSRRSKRSLRGARRSMRMRGGMFKRGSNISMSERARASLSAISQSARGATEGLGRSSKAKAAEKAGEVKQAVVQAAQDARGIMKREEMKREEMKRGAAATRIQAMQRGQSSRKKMDEKRAARARAIEEAKRNFLEFRDKLKGFIGDDYEEGYIYLADDIESVKKLIEEIDLDSSQLEMLEAEFGSNSENGILISDIKKHKLKDSK